MKTSYVNYTNLLLCIFFWRQIHFEDVAAHTLYLLYLFSFSSIEDNTGLVQRANQMLMMTHYSRPLFESNVRSAYDILAGHKGKSGT